MKTEKFQGNSIKVKAGRGQAWGKMTAVVNGEPYPVVENFDEVKALEEIKRDLAHIQSMPIDGDRWSAKCYAPGTYELCDAGIHPREIGGQCTHSTCVA